jgi:hypothetical protein
MSNGFNDLSDPNEREDVPFPAHGPVNVPDAFEMAAQAAQAAGYPFPPAMAPPVPMARPQQPMRLVNRAGAAAPALSAINSPMQVLEILARLNPEKVRLAGTIFGRSAGSEGALLAALCRVDPPVLTALLSLAGDIMQAVGNAGEPNDLLVNLELLGTVLQVMAKPQQNAQALQAIGLLLG